MWATYFGDDELTATDGSYVRLLRTRKWLYLSAAMAVLNVGGHLDVRAVSKLTGNAVELSSLAISIVILAGFALTSIQYGLLISQTRLIYDLVLAKRFSTSRREELDRLRKALNESERAYLTTKEEEEQEVKDLELFQGSAVVRRKTKSGELILPSDSLAKLDRLRAQMIEERAALEVARENLEEALAEDPATRPGFKSHEQWLDWLRIYPPALTAALAWITVLSVTLWPIVRPD
jgi:hypothetical protein